MSNNNYCVVRNAKSEDAQNLKQNSFRQLPNDYAPDRTSIMIDQKNNAFWLVNERDIQQCNVIAQKRDGQSISVLSNLQSLGI